MTDPTNTPVRPFDTLEATVAGGGISWRNAYLLMIANAFNYPKVLEVSGKDDGFEARYKERTAPLGVQDARLVTDDTVGVDTEAIVGKTAGGAFVSFRGSEPRGSVQRPDWRSAVADWLLVNARIKAVQAPSYGHGSRVHKGFRNAFQAVHEKLVTTLEEMDVTSDSTQPLWITGHSLGGALAVLAGYRLRALGFPVEAVYTFGAPHVGNSGFRSAFRALRYHPVGTLNDRTFAIVNENDPVPVLLDQRFVDEGGYNRDSIADLATAPTRGKVRRSGYRHVGRFHNLMNEAETIRFFIAGSTISDFNWKKHGSRAYLEALHSKVDSAPKPDVVLELATGSRSEL